MKKMQETHVKRVIQEEFKKFSGGVECDEPSDEVLAPMVAALQAFGENQDQAKFEETFMPLLREFVQGQLDAKGIYYEK